MNRLAFLALAIPLSIGTTLEPAWADKGKAAQARAAAGKGGKGGAAKEPDAFEHIVPSRQGQAQLIKQRIVKPLLSDEPTLPAHASQGYLFIGAQGTGKRTMVDALETALGAGQKGNEKEKAVKIERFGVNSGFPALKGFVDGLQDDQSALAIIDNANVLFSSERGPHLIELMQKARKKKVIFVGLADKGADRPEIDPLAHGKRYLETTVEFTRSDPPARRKALPVIAQSLGVEIDAKPAQVEEFIQQTHGYTDGELAKVLSEAHEQALANGRDKVEHKDLMAAVDRIPSFVQRRFGFRVPRGKIDDIVGADVAKDQVRRLLLRIQHPEAFEALGVREVMDNGVAFIGDPGGGKTALAMAVAAELNLPFASLSATARNKYVGEAGRVIREAYEALAEAGGGVLFLDELDSLAPQRDDMTGNDPGARETGSALLEILDGVRRSDKVIVIAATNRPGITDDAILRQGRIGRIARFDKITPKQAKQLLEIKTEGMKLDDDVDFGKVAAAMKDFSGASATAVPQRAAEFAILRVGGVAKVGKATKIKLEDFIKAAEEVSNDRSAGHQK